MDLTKEEEKALDGEEGEVAQLAYRILVATGKATDAERLVPIKWAHLSGVNYNTIGDAGEEFLASLSKNAKVRVKTTLNPMGYDIDHVKQYDIDENFIKKQESIRDSYVRMGVIPSFSCIPYEIFDLPEDHTQVSFAESNAAIYANSVIKLKTNKESAFSALASALVGKSPYFKEQPPDITIQMKIKDPNEMTYGMLGFFAGNIANSSVRISGVGNMDTRSCKSICGGMGTSGMCSKFILEDGGSEKVDFDEKELQNVYDTLNTTNTSDLIALGSPQLGLSEMADLGAMLKGRSFKKRCMIFCPRTVQNKARELGYMKEIERAGGEILSDCCICLSPLINKKQIDGVTTNSIKGAYYLKNSNGVDVNLKSLHEIIQGETG